jgi:hypothetical protein
VQVRQDEDDGIAAGRPLGVDEAFDRGGRATAALGEGGLSARWAQVLGCVVCSHGAEVNDYALVQPGNPLRQDAGDHGGRGHLLGERQAEGPHDGQGGLNAAAEPRREPWNSQRLAIELIAEVGLVAYQGWSSISQRCIRGTRGAMS